MPGDEVRIDLRSGEDRLVYGQPSYRRVLAILDKGDGNLTASLGTVLGRQAGEGQGAG